MNIVKKKAGQILNLASSLFVASILIFLLFEFCPSFISKLGINIDRYEAFKERYIQDPQLVFKIKPNYIYHGKLYGDVAGLKKNKSDALDYRAQYDHEGFRNSRLTSKPKVAIIGDSFVEFGLDEEDTLSSRLWTYLNEPVGNYSLGWYGPRQYLALLKDYVIPKNIKIVVLCFFEGNDLMDTRQYFYWKQGKGYYDFNLDDNKLIQNYFRSVKRFLKAVANLMFRFYSPREVNIVLNNERYVTNLVYPLNNKEALNLNKTLEFQEFRKTIQKFKQLSDENNIKSLFVFIPSKGHTYLPYMNKRTEESMRLSEVVEEEIKKVVSETGIPYLSLTEHFRNLAEKGELAFYLHDTHWNGKGRELGAKVIGNFIQENYRTPSGGEG